MQTRVNHMGITGCPPQPTPEGTNPVSMVTGGLHGLSSLQDATKWLHTKLSVLKGPQPAKIETRAKLFKGVIVAQFSSKASRDEAVSLLHGAGLNTTDDSEVWAKVDLPIHTRAQKSFLNSLRWRLSQWGYVYNELEIDAAFTRLTVGDKQVLSLAIEKGAFKYQWCEAWANWAELQSSPRVSGAPGQGGRGLEEVRKG